ncbi:hypothetical protein LZF95_25085 [Algoriphagus sp. AGSA1]|uniref:hypothetical protein n=1 Tax=Algoriphagus sp. AGSA1 TaxID=2907213 RepID=UPI001F3EACFC|nr:hypothetical protein [Algoriphagus sp. AGSA1]MCE7057984.1 hypothetical protein [Algoriphagus sp. AGSA1]
MQGLIARQIETLSRALRQFIELEQEKDATVILHIYGGEVEGNEVDALSSHPQNPGSIP